MAKIIVGVTIVEFCKVGTQIGGGGDIDPIGLCYRRVALSCRRLVSRFSISIFQEHLPVQYHHDWVFIRQQQSENSPFSTEKSPANV